MDRVRYEVLWLIGTFSVFLVVVGADGKVTRAAIAVFGIYAAHIVIGKISAWWTKPDEPATDARA
ncbi:hypothetical protein [Methylopila sp. M107]|uniref:hypothetical protein n=1 Tax=Methylopila sp. M107 TaxID=1101190 RepID=UPI0003A48CAF|nr:hypothetical protein [Methylopila sp. M107]